MKTTLILATGCLALLSSSCLTMYPVDPMTNEPSKSMMPDQVASKKVAPAKPSPSQCSCATSCKSCATSCKGAPGK